MLKRYLWHIYYQVYFIFCKQGTKIKASGHACGVSGPITLLVNILGIQMIWLFLLMPVVYWSRINLGRHNIVELILGTFIGIVSTLVAVSIV